MPWLWFAGPFVVVLIYFLMSLWPTQEEKRIQRELARWLDDFLGPLKVGQKGAAKKSRSRLVRGLPSTLEARATNAGDGARVADVVLVPKHAYMTVRQAGGLSSSNQYTVAMMLEQTAPEFTCRPIPIVDGRPAENRGIAFKDPEFTTAFLVEGAQAKVITKWLSDELREALLEVPEAFLSVGGKSMTLTLYGFADAEKLDQLVDAADALFAEHGSSARSLFPEEEEKPAKKKTSKVVPISDKALKRDAAGKKSDAPGKKTGARVPAPPAEPAAPSALRLQATAIDLGLYAVAGAIIALVVGKFPFFHPAALFNSPDIVTTEAWQGGWTTKGVGVFIAAESLLLGLFVYQSYAGAQGRSIGMHLLGLRVVGEDGGAPGFLRGAVMRRWVHAALPLLVALVTARPFGARAFFAKLLSWPVALACVVVLGVSAVLMMKGDGIHDRISKTRAVLAERWRLPSIQLGAEKGDQQAVGRLMWASGLLLGLIALNVVVVSVLNAGFWPYEAPYRVIDWAVQLFRN